MCSWCVQMLWSDQAKPSVVGAKCRVAWAEYSQDDGGLRGAHTWWANTSPWIPLNMHYLGFFKATIVVLHSFKMHPFVIKPYYWGGSRWIWKCDQDLLVSSHMVRCNGGLSLQPGWMSDQTADWTTTTFFSVAFSFGYEWNTYPLPVVWELWMWGSHQTMPYNIGFLNHVTEYLSWWPRTLDNYILKKVFILN